MTQGKSSQGRSFPITAFSVLTSLLLFSKVTLGEEPKKWQEKMKTLAATMGDLLPEIVSAKGDPKKIEEGAKKLSELAHRLNPKMLSAPDSLPPDADPSLAYFSSLFEEDVNRAYWAAKGGYTEYSKNILKAVTSHCIACHTRHDRGPDFPTFPLSPKAESLSPLEKAELFAATRQFDKALTEYRSVLSDSAFAKSQQADWGRAAREALTVAVRAKGDPSEALKLVDQVLSSSATPEYVKRYVLKWKESITKWQKEPAQKDMGEQALYADMNRLLKEARAMQEYPMDHSADVLYLRASARAHELMGAAPSGKHVAEALYVAGNAYEVLNSNNLSPLHEMYYEACVRKAPHTKLGRECYARYEESVVFGFTGSAGTSIPPEVEKTMRDLDSISKQKGSK